MASEEPRKDAVDKVEARPTPSPATPAGPVPGTAHSPSVSFAPTRPLYIPQFTAATQMILKRMKGEPSSLSAALSQASSSPAVTASIPSATYEDVKRRLVMGMNMSTQMTIQMPSTAPVRSTSSTVPAPTAPKPTAPKPGSATAGMSAIRKVTAGLTGLPKHAPAKPAASKVSASSETKPTKKLKQSTAPRSAGGKRKRTKGHASDDDDDDDDDDDEEDSDMSSTSGLSSPADANENPAITTTPSSSTALLLAVTKSGRQVLKPAAYNPAAMDAYGGSRRKGAGNKRTAEQALCKKCTRMHSPASNQIVFCDGCNDGWHQLCHDPWIESDTVRDQTKGWFCAGCLSAKNLKRERQGSGSGFKRQRVETVTSQVVGSASSVGGGGGGGGGKTAGRESWASRTVQQKRAYLSTLPQQELVGLLMACLELHPDLPIFPASSSSSSSSSDGVPATTPRSLFAGTTTEGLFPRAEAHPTGQINFVRKVAAAAATTNGSRQAAAGKGGRSGNGNGNGNGVASGGLKGKEGSQDRIGGGEDDDEFDPLAPLWPKPGMGLHMRLPADTEDGERLVDDDDYEAFSVIVYDEKGRKVEENGMKV